MMTLTIHEGLANVLLIAWLLGIPLYWLVEITRVAFLNASRTSQEEVVSLDARVVDQVTLKYLLQAPPVALPEHRVAVGLPGVLELPLVQLQARNKMKLDGAVQHR